LPAGFDRVLNAACAGTNGDDSAWANDFAHPDLNAYAHTNGKCGPRAVYVAEIEVEKVRRQS
jgi:hypothetical protein